jgi:hypothetical protein
MRDYYCHVPFAVWVSGVYLFGEGALARGVCIDCVALFAFCVSIILNLVIFGLDPVGKH